MPYTTWGPYEAKLEGGLAVFLERVGQRIVHDDTQCRRFTNVHLFLMNFTVSHYIFLRDLAKSYIATM